MDPRLKAEDDGVWGGAHAKLQPPCTRKLL